MPQTAPAPEATLTDLLASAEQLTHDERLQIVRQAQVLVEQLYVHLPLKRAMHAVDPLQRLRLLEHRLASFDDDDRRFHDEMIDIFIGLRDLHTNYVLPAPYAGRSAVLPFRIEEYYEGEARRYLVSAVSPALALEPFERGVEVTHWNGIPIDRAVALNGERNGGSNLDARHARGLASLTQRPMSLLAPPEEDWVDVTFLAGGYEHTQRFTWHVSEPPPAAAGTGTGPSALADPVAGAQGIDLLVEEIRRAQKAVLAPEAMELERAMADDPDGAFADLDTTSTLPDVLQFRTVPGPDVDVGYLRIRTFSVDLDPFSDEVLRILSLLPQDGLIVDVRGNGGGKIAAGERLLQLFTPRTIEPSHLHFINTPLTLEATAKPSYAPWRESIVESVETGAPFSDGLPLAPDYPAFCNEIGQVYHGPVVLITDALCYSTTDIFAAGFQDHEIGPVIGTSAKTGAGGANVWAYKDMMDALPDHFDPLPKQASMRVAIRRTTRVGKRAGDPLEDLGVVSDHVHDMTRRDLLEANVDLLAEAARVLAAMPRTTFSALTKTWPDGVDVIVTTAGVDRIDVLSDGRPVQSRDVTDGQHLLSVPFAGVEPQLVELRGFAAGRLVAARKLRGRELTGLRP